MSVSKKYVLIVGMIVVSFLFAFFLSSCGGEVYEESFDVDDSQVAKEVEFGTKSPLRGLVVTVKLSDDSVKTLARGDGGYQVHTGGYDEESPGDYTMTISYKEFEPHEIIITVLEEEIIDETIDPDVYLEGIEVKDNTVKTLFLFGEEFTAEDIVVEKVYSDGVKEVLPSSEYLLDAGDFDSDSQGEYTIDIYYTPTEDEEYHTSYTVTVTPPNEYSPFEGIALITHYVQKDFMVGEEFNHDRLVVEKLIREDGVLRTETADPSEVSVRTTASYDKDVPGEYAVFVSVEFFEVVYFINVLDYVTDLRVQDGRRIFAVGESFNADSLKVYTVMASGEEEQLFGADYSLDLGGYDPETEGAYTITVTYLEDESISTTYEVQVMEEPQ